MRASAQSISTFGCRHGSSYAHCEWVGGWQDSCDSMPQVFIRLCTSTAWLARLGSCTNCQFKSIRYYKLTMHATCEGDCTYKYASTNCTLVLLLIDQALHVANSHVAV